jgi:hypothetical protein
MMVSQVPFITQRCLPAEEEQQVARVEVSHQRCLQGCHCMPLARALPSRSFFQQLSGTLILTGVHRDIFPCRMPNRGAGATSCISGLGMRSQNRMLMFDLVLIFTLALLLVAAVSAWRPAIRSSLIRPRFWIGIGAAAVILSLTSVIHSTRMHSGTGWRTSFGWPKPWYGRWESFEGGGVSSGFDLLYFAGNAMFYATMLLAGWLVWRVMTQAAASKRPPAG